MTALGWKADINQSRFWTPKREYLLLPIADIQTGKIRPKTRSAFGQEWPVSVPTNIHSPDFSLYGVTGAWPAATRPIRACTYSESGSLSASI